MAGNYDASSRFGDQQIYQRGANGKLAPVSPDNPMVVVLADGSGSGTPSDPISILGAGTAAGNQTWPASGGVEKDTDITIYFGGSAAGTTATFSTFLLDINARQTVLPGIRANGASIAQVTTANVGDVVEYTIPRGCRLRIDYTAPTGGGTISIKGVI